MATLDQFDRGVEGVLASLWAVPSSARHRCRHLGSRFLGRFWYFRCIGFVCRLAHHPRLHSPLRFPDQEGILPITFGETMRQPCLLFVMKSRESFGWRTDLDDWRRICLSMIKAEREGVEASS